MPPLPSPGNILRVRMFFAPSATNEWGSRFFISYTGGPPTSADLDTYATAIAGHFNTDLIPYVNTNISLINVEVTDLSSDSGNQGLWTGNYEGGRGSGYVPEDVCALVNFDIGRRYRGGKPKLFLPPGAPTDFENESSWTSAFVTAVSSGWGSFMAANLATSYSSFAPVDNVNISFYSGFTPFKTPSGRYRNIPTPRETPLVDLITNHSVRAQVGSQRRRRTAFIQP